MSDRASAAYKRGVRFRLSLVLLVSALNLAGIAAMFGALMSPAALRDLRPEHDSTWQTGHAAEALRLRMMLDALAAARDRRHPAFPEDGFSRLTVMLEETLGEYAVPVLPALDAFRTTAADWYAAGCPVPADYQVPMTMSSTAADEEEATPATPSEGRKGRFETMDAAYQHFRLILADAAAERLTAMPQRVSSVATYLIAWAFLMALVYIYVAWRLQGLISTPLSQLADSAIAIGQGELDAQVPVVSRNDEIGALAQAIDTMRANLRSHVEQLREGAERMRVIFDSMSDGVLLMASDGRIRQANACAAALLGVSREWLDSGRASVEDLGIGELVGPVTDDARLEIEHRPEDSRLAPRHLRVVQSPVSGREGGVAGNVTVIQDVTHQKEMEQLKNDFFSMVTHELKTPLTAIEGYSRLLLKGRPGPLTDDQRRFLESLVSQSNVLKSMIQDLLDMSRIAAGRFKLEPGPVDVGEMVAAAVDRFQHQAVQRHVALELRAPAGEAAVGVVARLDRTRMDQVLGNLLSNAIKFTPEGGRVSLEWQVDPATIEIRVRDTGVGVHESERKRIFEKFYQVERGDTRSAGGAGLGLYVCKELVTSHGGTIAVTPNVDRGSVFVVRLPREGVPATAVEDQGA